MAKKSRISNSGAFWQKKPSPIMDGYMTILYNAVDAVPFFNAGIVDDDISQTPR